MSITKKLSAIPYGQAKVIIDDNTITLISYNTVVATITDNWLEIYGLYSMTTRKHISAFVREYAHISYQSAKSLYEDGYRYDITTGEIVEIGG